MVRRVAVMFITAAVCLSALYSITLVSVFASDSDRADALAIIGEQTGMIASDNAIAADCIFDEGYGVFLCAEAPPATPPVRDEGARERVQAHLAGGNSVLLVPDSTNDRVMTFDPMNGEPIDLDFIPSDPANMGTAVNAILSPGGDSILVSDQINDDVLEYGLDGTFIGVYAGNNPAVLDNIRGIDLRPNGNLLVTVGSGANEDSVAEFDTSGTYLGNFIAAGSGGLNSPFDVYPRPGVPDWLVAGIDNDAVTRYDYSTGASLGLLNTVNNFPEQVTTAANGDVLVANFSGTQEGIVRFTSAGTLVNVINPVTGGGYRGVYELGNGNLLVTTGTGVYEVTPAGALVEAEIAGVSGRFIEEVTLGGAAITLDKTVGLSPSSCATTDSITIGTTTTVYYCYTVENTGNVTLTRHDLVDSELGTILNDFPFTLVPGASAFITQSATISQTVVNTAVWTATVPTPQFGAGLPVAVATDAATVTLGAPEITLSKTVGLSSSTCATTSAITVTANTAVFYCYVVENTGDVTVTRHTLVDSELGTILTDFPFTLVPGASAFITQSATITETTVNVATWTAAVVTGGPSASATDTATVTVGVPTAVTLGTLVAAPDTMPRVAFVGSGLLLLAAGVLLLRRR